MTSKFAGAFGQHGELRTMEQFLQCVGRNRFTAARLGNVGGRMGALETDLGSSQFREFYSLSDGCQSSMGLPSGSLSHAKVPMPGYTSIFSIATPLLLRWLRTSSMFFTV